MSTTQVLVVGGGYAGVMAANRLQQRDDVAVTLVNPRDRFVDRIRLHQLAAGTHEATRDYSSVLHERVQLVVDGVEHIDAAARRATLRSGAQRDYDYLIYAVGSTGVPIGPGAPASWQHAHPLAELEGAERLRDALAQTSPRAPVTVVGAGPTGIEIAGELAEAGRTVTLVSGGAIGPYLHPRGRRGVARALATQGVTVLEGWRAVEVTADAVRLSNGRVLPSAVTIWTAGFGTPDLARRSGLTTDAVGRLLTDETLTSVDDDRIVAAGDAADPSGHPMRMSCQAAVPLGAQAAETVLSRIAGTTPAPVDSGFVGQCVSVGRRYGVFQAAHKDDTARGFALTGRPGAWLKEAVCRSIPIQLAAEARRPGAMRWPKDAARTDAVRSAPIQEVA